MSLINHNNQYNIYWDNFIYNTLTLSGGSYTKRHFELANESEGLIFAKHIAVGMIEFIPIIGAVVAVFERMIVSCMQAKLVPELNRQIIDLTRNLQTKNTNDESSRIADKAKDEEIARLHQQLEDAEASAARTTQEQDRLREGLQTAHERTNKEKDEEIARLHQQLEDAEASAARTTQEQDRLREGLQTAHERTNKEKDNEIIRLRAELENARKEREAGNKDQERMKQELLRVNSLYEKNIVEKRQLTVLQEQIALAHKNAAEKSQECDKLRLQLLSKIDEADSSKHKLVFLEKQLQETKLQLEELQERADLYVDNDQEDLIGSFVLMDNKLVEDKDSLFTYVDQPSGQPKIGLNPILTEENWNDLLIANDLSYAEAKFYTTSQDKKNKVQRQYSKAVAKLTNTGWTDYRVLWGKTGKNNSSDDATCIVLYNPSKNLIYVAFHGSRNGSYFGNSPGTDWDSNYDSELVSAKAEDLYGAPEGVLFHRGIGLNFISVQETLFKTLSEMVRGINSNPHIILTGHSKGGGEAQIAAPAVTQYLQDEGLNAKVSTVTFSAPMTFNKQGAQWANNVVNIRNLLRIKVLGDPVTYGSLIGQDYAHAGMRLREKVSTVNRRSIEWHGDEQLGFFDRFKESCVNYHYAANREGSWCFVPEIVMPYHALMEVFHEWEQSYTGQGMDFIPK